ncbi:transglycosylase SLT domain-containing protein [Streptomyces sp. NPDC057257]|uniref:transglycosylase SLT domain-containing protein n=1 Tax=Streptomyces sp. NPDC057257 TaxID=3346071 RepID=UPI003634388D
MTGNTFDAGSIESRLVLDRSEFNDDLRAVKAEVAEFERQRHQIKFTADTSAAMRDVALMKADLASLRDVRLNVSVSGSNAQIRAIQQSAGTLDGRKVKLGISLDGAATVQRQLLNIQRRADILDGRTINIRTDVDTAGSLAQIAALRTALGTLNNTTTTTTVRTTAMGSALKKAKPGMADLVALAMAAGPALLPIAGYLTNIAAGSVALGVSVGAGVGLFGAAVAGAVKNVSDLDKQVKTAQQTLTTQKAALDRLTPGTDAYGKQLEKVEQAQQALNKAQAAYTPQQRAFSTATNGMKSAWQGFIKSTQSVTLPVATTFVNAVSTALPKAVPAVKAIAPEFKVIADDVARWVSNGGVDRFFQTVIKTGVPAFHNLRDAAKDVLGVLGTGYRAFLPEALRVSDAIKTGADRLKGWSAGGGFQAFLGYVKANGPQVREFFTALGQAAGNILKAIQPLGSPALKLVTIAAQLVAALPVSWIQAVYLGFIAWRAALLGLLVINAVKTAITGLRLAWVTLNFVFAASPIGVIITLAALLVGAIVLIATKTTWFQTAWRVAWAGIQIAASAVWNTVLKPAFNGIMVGLHAVGTAATWLWANAIKPAFDFISVAARLLAVVLGTILFTPVYLAVKVLGAIFGWLWKVAIKPAFDGIASGASWLWTHALRPTFNAIVAGAKLWWDGVKLYVNAIVSGFKTVGSWGKWLWNNALHPAFNWIAGGAKSLYNGGIKPAVGWISDAFKTVGKWGKWLWTNALKPAWDSIKKGTDVLKDGMVKTFGAMRDGIGKVWNAIKGVVAKPINFVISTVYNGGVVAVWNKIADAVGLKSKELKKVGAIKFRRGGPVTGGAPGVDSVPAMMMPGEHVWTADEVQNAGGHRAMAQMRAMFASAGRSRLGAVNTSPKTGGGAYRFKDGGGFLGTGVGPSVGSIVDKAKSVGGSVLGGLKDLARGAMAAVVNPILTKLISVAKGGVKAAIPGSPAWEDLVAGTATAPIQWIKDFVAKDDKKYAAIGGKIPSGQHKSIIDAALAAAHIPPPGTLGQWEAGLNTLISRESGWNASAINRWDSNAKAGHPSQGLAQTIPGTFNAYVPSSLKHLGILNPIANVAAAARYIVARYGNITRVQQANANKPPQGYATGGVMTQGLHLVGEKGPELVASSGNDRVYTYAETMRMLKAAGSTGGGEMTGTLALSGDVTLKVGDQEFTAYLDGQARQTISAVVSQAAGSR